MEYQYIVAYVNCGENEYEIFAYKDDAVDTMKTLINSESVENVQIFVRVPFEIKIEFI